MLRAIKDLTIRQKRLGGIVVLSLVILLMNSLAVLRFGAGSSTVSFLTISAVVSSALSAIALLYAALNSVSIANHILTAWLLLAAAQSFYTLGEISRMIIDPGSGGPVDGLLRLFFASLYLAGITLLIRKNTSANERMRALIDRAIVFIAVFLAVWNFILGPIAQIISGQPFLTQLHVLGYPIASLVLIWAILMVLYCRFEIRPVNILFLLAGGLGLVVVSDLAYSYFSILNSSPRSGLLDLGWITASLLILIAGVWQGIKNQPNPTFSFLPQDEGTPVKLTVSQAIALPYIFLAVAFFILFWSNSHTLPMSRSTIAAAIALLNALILLRQFITIRENSQLYQDLRRVMDKVRQQTDQLSLVNRDLKVEVEERKRAEEQLAYDALHDSLTGLPNRALFIDRLHHTIEYTQRHTDYHFAVLFLDLDHFKIINDSLGHRAGDQLLVAFANRLRLCMRLSDTVARLGGDEFVIMLEDTKDETDVISAAHRIEDRLKSSFTIDGREVYITASIGIVRMGNGYGSPEDILRDADIAMYSAKSLGKSRYEIFTPNLRDKAMLRLEMENDMRAGLERGEFFLVYQPILSFATGEISGFEALLRWNHPKRGLVYPMDFIPMAEETGLISPLGEWVLHEGCRQICVWQERFPCDPPLTMSINVSGVQLLQANFVGLVDKALKDTGLSGNSLSLEITERVCLNGSNEMKDVFAELSKLGIQFHIDDFGVGYSSLSYLQNFPIQMLKIDRSFTEKIDTGAYNCEIVRSIISLAHDLGMGAIAEGVETEKQLSELRKYGCNYGQGYLLSYPLTSERIETLISSRMSIPAPADHPTSTE